MRRILAPLLAAGASLMILAAPAAACGGLIGPNGAVNLLRTTTFAGYHDGVEHYVTAFAFAGGGGAFGSITPLPGIPTDVVRGGDWTLQRLVRETDPAARGSVCLAGGARAGGERRGPARDPHRRARHHHPARWRRRGRPVGQGPWLPPPARCARGARLLRRALTDLHGRSLRCGCRRRARPGRRRRDAGAPHHPDRQPVGAAAHPGPRQGLRRACRGRRLPADRRPAGAAPESGPARSPTAASSSTTAPPPATACSTDLRSDKGMEWIPDRRG